MNFLKKKLKPFASGLTAAGSAGHQSQHQNKNLEDDLYDEYIIEAPPHPSELLALGVDPSEIDVNDPEKLKELYKKAKAGGKDKLTNSVLLAKQRQKEEIEEKKKTREEWKFFDSLTARVEQAVKESQKTLDTLKESSAVNKLTEPEYELRQTPDEVFKPQTTVKQEKGANDWINFGDEETNNKNKKEQKIIEDEEVIGSKGEELDEFGCRKRKSSAAAAAQNFVVEELLEDFGLDLRTAEQRKAEEQAEKKRKDKLEEERKLIEQQKANELKKQTNRQKSGIDIKAVARPRPRPTATNKAQETVKTATNSESSKKEQEIDPFDTSFVASQNQDLLLEGPNNNKLEAGPSTNNNISKPTLVDDPFDTSYIDL